MDSTLKNLVFWSMGYGAWSGFCIMPLLFIKTSSPYIRLTILAMAIPTGAFMMTALNFILFGYAAFMHKVCTIMMNPEFLMGLCASITVSIGITTSYMYNSHLRLTYEKPVEESVEECVEESEEQSVNSEENEEWSRNSEKTINGEPDNEESDTDNSDTEESDTDKSEEVHTEENSEQESESQISEVDNSWKETANFEALRSAPLLPDSESESENEEKDKN